MKKSTASIASSRLNTPDLPAVTEAANKLIALLRGDQKKFANKLISMTSSAVKQTDLEIRGFAIGGGPAPTFKKLVELDKFIKELDLASVFDANATVEDLDGMTGFMSSFGVLKFAIATFLDCSQHLISKIRKNKRFKKFAGESFCKNGGVFYLQKAQASMAASSSVPSYLAHLSWVMMATSLEHTVRILCAYSAKASTADGCSVLFPNCTVITYAPFDIDLALFHSKLTASMPGDARL